MSAATVIYLRAAALLWVPCVIMIGGNWSSRLGRLAAAALLAAGWPLAIPLTLTALALRGRQSRRRQALRVLRQASVIPLPKESAESVAGEF